MHTIEPWLVNLVNTCASLREKAKMKTRKPYTESLTDYAIRKAKEAKAEADQMVLDADETDCFITNDILIKVMQKEIESERWLALA